MAAVGDVVSLLCWCSMSVAAVGAELCVIGATKELGAGSDVVAIDVDGMLVANVDDASSEVVVLVPKLAEADVSRLEANHSQLTKMEGFGIPILLTTFWRHILSFWTSDTRIACLHQATPDEAFIATIEDTTVGTAVIPLQNPETHSSIEHHV